MLEEALEQVLLFFSFLIFLYEETPVDDEVITDNKVCFIERLPSEVANEILTYLQVNPYKKSFCFECSQRIPVEYKSFFTFNKYPLIDYFYALKNNYAMENCNFSDSLLEALNFPSIFSIENFAFGFFHSIQGEDKYKKLLKLLFFYERLTEEKVKKKIISSLDANMLIRFRSYLLQFFYKSKFDFFNYEIQSFYFDANSIIWIEPTEELYFYFIINHFYLQSSAYFFTLIKNNFIVEDEVITNFTSKELNMIKSINNNKVITWIINPMFSPKTKNYKLSYKDSMLFIKNINVI